MTFIKNNSYILLIMVLCITFSFIGTKKIGTDVAFQEITVVEGDTLWGLSVIHGRNIPTEKWIEEVINLNALPSSKIQIGDDLKLPLIKALDNRDLATHFVGDTE